MDDVLDVIELARESYLSKEGQLQVIYEAYSNWKRSVSFSPLALVEQAEKREAAQHSGQVGTPWFWVCRNCEQKNGKEYNVCWRCDQPRRETEV